MRRKHYGTFVIYTAREVKTPSFLMMVPLEWCRNKCTRCSFAFTVMHYTVTDFPGRDTFHMGRNEIYGTVNYASCAGDPLYYI